MTQFYINADGGNDSNSGTGPLDADAWLTLNKFTEDTRSAGDIATLRRGTTAQYDNGADVSHTSDGTLGNPIIVEADYDDVVWTGGPDFVNSSQTYTPIFGSKTMEANTTITGIVVGDVVFNTTDGDDPREFSYEVTAVSGTTLTIQHPWKGSTGATKTLKVMPANPLWGNLSSHDFRIEFSDDRYWKIQGMDSDGTEGSNIGTIRATGDSSILLKDLHVENANTGNLPLNLALGVVVAIKCKLKGVGTEDIRTGTGNFLRLETVITEGGTVHSIERATGGSAISAKECEFDEKIESFTLNDNNQFNEFINCTFGATEFDSGVMAIYNAIKSQDHDGVVGASYLCLPTQQTATDPLVVEETTTVRSGGSNTSLKIAPSTNSLFSTAWELSREVLLEISIFATTASKQYEIFFRPDATANWTADPTNAELWIELEAWGHASNNYRKITKSTGVIDMNGSTTYTALTVTVAPDQEGVAFLRVWYAKPKESGKTNVFFIDPVPVIT